MLDDRWAAHNLRTLERCKMNVKCMNTLYVSIRAWVQLSRIRSPSFEIESQVAKHHCPVFSCSYSTSVVVQWGWRIGTYPRIIGTGGSAELSSWAALGWVLLLYAGRDGAMHQKYLTFQS
eukprot:6065805-Amphidinium_carterae.1